jgi:hypothetical protein
MLVTFLAVPETGNAKEISVDFARTPSVSVVKAEIIDVSDQKLVIVGKLNRSHRWPTRGHLHVYSYSDTGALISEIEHRMRRLKSKKRSHTMFNFKISITDALDETSRVFLEYHGPGHSEKLQIQK